MKKILAFIMAVVTIMSLAACGTTDNPTETTGAVTESSKTQSEQNESSESVLAGKTVGFSQTDSMSAWRTTETDSIKEHVEQAGGEFIVKDAGGDIATQESDIRDLIAAGVDFLVVAPLEDNGLQSALQEAMDNEIPVILVDRAITGEAGTHFTTAIMSDFVWEGEQCANALMEALPNGGNIVIINGGYDSSTSTDRQDGFVNALNPEKYHVVAEQDGEWLMDKAQAVMENILQAQGGENIDAVFCVTDDMVQGAMKAIDATGLECGKDILTIGIDGTRAAFEDIEKGRQLASCTCSPYFGPIVVETIEKITNGEEIPAHITNNDTLYIKDNVQVDLGF